MRSSLRLISAAVIAAGLGLLPASAAVNGTSWAVLAPTFTGTTMSYIRLFNGSLTGSSTFTVMMIGSPSGRTYGSGNVSIPKSASIQYPLLTSAGSPSIQSITKSADLNGGDTAFTVYVQSPDITSGYQHVTYNSGNTFFENVSTCRYTLNDSIITNNNSMVLLNVHAANSGMSNWPSTVVIHNFWNAATTYKLTVVDADTGSTVGTMNQLIAANSTAALTMQSIQSTLGKTPPNNGVNIFVTDPTGAQPNASATHITSNGTLTNSTFNLTLACAVNAPVTTSVGGGGFVGY